ncbi:MAG: hypothetical protein ACKV2U_17285 [Bryobacteraceae bacterium]
MSFADAESYWIVWGSWMGEDSGALPEVQAIPSEGPPRPDDPAESLRKMEKRIDAELSPTQYSAPCLPCHRPWIELVLYLDSGEPAAHAPFSLDLPNGGSQSGELDERGYVRIYDVEADPETVDIEVTVLPQMDGPDIYKIYLAPKKPGPEPEGEEDEDTVELGDVEVPWEPY